tara:strand:+ start:194 stop:520 length:327 start_codon:yes stop_codon:yes gene_type:complete
VRGFSGALRHEVTYMENDVKVACAFPAGIKTAIAANAKIDVPVKSNLNEDQQKAIAEASFLTTPEHAAADILNGVRKGRVRIRAVNDQPQSILSSGCSPQTMGVCFFI